MWKDCLKLQDELVRMRRELHRIPETGVLLPKTREYVEEKLNEYGIPFKENKSDSGLVAVIEGEKGPGKTIALRADMDALPVTEGIESDYKSLHEGKMHACGHDAHMAMLLGAAKVLSEHRPELCGRIKLLFQADEEEVIGAKNMIGEGCMEGVDAVFGTHIGCILSKDIPAGKLVVAPGCIMASNDRFIIKVKGTGCHGSTPEKGVDPVNIAAHIIINLQEIIAREIPAVKAAAVTIGKVEAGFAYNVIPSEVRIEGTVRTLDDEIRKYIAKRIEEISVSTAKTFRGDAECHIEWGVPPVENDKTMAAFAAECAKEVLGEEEVITNIASPNMGAEDFAEYLKLAPGAFMFLSSSNAAKHTDEPHHSPLFNIDEDVLWEGSTVFVNIAERFLAE